MEKIKFEEVQSLLDSGKKPEGVFDRVDVEAEGFRVVSLHHKWNYLDRSNKLLSSDQWFSWCERFYDGFGVVVLNGKNNFIKPDGELLSEQWFDWCYRFDKGLGRVVLGSKWNYIKPDGKLLFKQWKKYVVSRLNEYPMNFSKIGEDTNSENKGESIKSIKESIMGIYNSVIDDGNDTSILPQCVVMIEKVINDDKELNGQDCTNFQKLLTECSNIVNRKIIRLQTQLTKIENELDNKILMENLEDYNNFKKSASTFRFLFFG